MIDVRELREEYRVHRREAGPGASIRSLCGQEIQSAFRVGSPQSRNLGALVQEGLNEVTDTPDRFLAVAPRFLGRPVESARHVDV